MKNLIYLSAIIVGLLAPEFVKAQEAPGQSERNNRKEVFQKHRAEIEMIKNDPNLSESEKEVLVREKRMALKEEMGPRKGEIKGKDKGMQKGKAKKEMKKRRGDLQKKLESIENDSSLSNEEKKAKKKALKRDVRQQWAETSPRSKGKGNEKKYKKGKEAKKKFQSIDDDPNLTDAEKVAKKKALKDKWKAKRGEKGGRLNSHGKGYGKDKGHQKSTEQKLENKVSNQNLTSEQIEKANRTLDKEEKKLQKLLKKGKIEEITYSERIANISRVRANLNSSK